ncbi:MAG: response regulator [Planctomycetes bacterium]|nr:response regulator [Planctomycetota bacterium]
MASLHEPAPRKAIAAADVTVVHFTGSKTSLHEATIHCIRDELLALADQPGGSDLVLDFSNVTFVSSMALGILVSLHKKLVDGGRHLTVRNLSPHVHEVFAVTRLDKVLDLRRAGQEAEPATDDGRPGSPAGVLVVDDETAVLCVVAARLRHEGFKVWLAGGGHQGIEVYQRHLEEIGVVLLDVQMPGMDGPQTLTVLQKLCPTVRCCFMTGNSVPSTEAGLLERGAVRVFRKPIVFTELIDTLNQLGSRSLRRRQDRWIEIP